MSSRLFRDSVPYRVDHIKSEISGIVFILPTLLILAFRHFRNFRIVFQSERFGIFLHWIASVIILSYGSIIPQRDQVVQRNQGETGSRSPLLSLGFKSRVLILIYVLRFICPLSLISNSRIFAISFASSRSFSSLSHTMETLPFSAMYSRRQSESMYGL